MRDYPAKRMTVEWLCENKGFSAEEAKGFLATLGAESTQAGQDHKSCSSPARPWLPAAVSDASEDFLYLVMRTMRLMVSMVIELAMFAFTVPFAWCAFCSLIYLGTFCTESMVFDTFSPTFNFITLHCVIMTPIFAAIVIGLWVQLMAVGLPYRYDATPPGLRTKKCWHCAAEIPDVLRCTICNTFRLGRVFTGGLYVAGLAVGVLWFVNDMLMVLLCATGSARGSGR